MKIVGGLLINRVIRGREERNEYLKYLESFVPYVDKLFVLNVTKQDLTEFYEGLKHYQKVEIADYDDMGEAYNYKILLEKALEEKATHELIMELGYYFEEGCFNNIRKYLLEKGLKDVAIITPAPLYGCQLHERKPEYYREVMGCKLVGTLVNLDIYQELGGFDLEYYQTTFDYDFCIRARLADKKILFLQNEVLRNVNYRLIERKIFFTTLTTYDKDPMELYYEIRNKLYLWNKYKYLDPAYIKLDKRITKGEINEMRTRDKGYRDKKIMIDIAKRDYKKGIRGKFVPSKY